MAVDDKTDEGANAANLAAMAADPRMEWFNERVSNLLHLKPEKWKKMVTVQEHVEQVMQFLDSPAVESILFYTNSKDEVVPTVKFPNQLKRKSVYAIKVNGAVQVTEKLDQNVSIGDLPPDPLEYLSTLIEQVYLPLLSNSKNLESWPQVVATDVLRHFHRLHGSVEVMAGKVKGKTILPMPLAGSAAGDGGSTQEGAPVSAPGSPVPTQAVSAVGSHLHQVESAIMDWTHQIREVIKSNSDSPLNEGLNPGPMVEIDFWVAKANNLSCIYKQLNDARIQEFASLLKDSNSSYWPVFEQMVSDVAQALEQAQDISVYLSPLRNLVERLETLGDFNELNLVIQPLMHLLTLIWQNSKHYNTPQRLTVFLTELSNDVIEQAKNFVNPADLFQSEPEESSERLFQAIEAINFYKHCYEEARLTVSKAANAKPWALDQKLFFDRLDQFTARLNQLAHLFSTIIEFNRLEKIEMGGIKGKALGVHLLQVFNEFVAAIQRFKTINYDILDLQTPAFQEDMVHFNNIIDDLDRRLSTILCQSFDNCAGIYSSFRLLDTFAGLLTREGIQKNFEPKYQALLHMVLLDFEQVFSIFTKFKENPPIFHNMAPVTGALTWTHRLRERCQQNMEKLLLIQHPILQSDDFKVLQAKYDEVLAAIKEFDEKIYREWTENIIDASEKNLGKPLLIRDTKSPEGLLKVNFDGKVVALLREVRYCGPLQVVVPDKASQIYAKSDSFRDFIFRLDHICQLYNQIKATVLPVEKPLIAKKMETIELEIEKGLSSVSWKSADMEQYVNVISTLVTELSTILQNVKNNAAQIGKILKNWVASRLLERKDSKKLLNMEDKDVRLRTAYEVIKKDGVTIHELVAETRKLVQVDEVNADWVSYRSFLDEIVTNGLFNVVHLSMQYLLQNMDKAFLKANDFGPLLEAKLELEGDRLVFLPSMDEDSGSTQPTFYATIVQTLDELYEVSTLVKRIALVNSAEGEGESDTFLGLLKENKVLSAEREEILKLVRVIMDECLVYRDTFEPYSHLWLENRQEYMKQFSNFSAGISGTPAADSSISASEEGTSNPGAGGLDQSLISSKLEKYETEIKRFDNIHKQLMSLDTEVILQGWFKIDARPVKQSLNLVVKKWSLTLTKQLSDQTVNLVYDMRKFVSSNAAGLTKKIVEGDYDSLIGAMGMLHAVKHRGEAMDGVFEPVRKILHLLRSCNVDLPDDIYKMVNDLPEEWSNVKKLAVTMRDQVAPLQAKEVDVLQQRCNKFEAKNHVFRENFRKTAPFKFEIGPENAYDIIDKAYADVCAITKEAQDLRASCELFEVTVSNYKQIGDCARDVSLLKSIWDMVGLVHHLFQNWKNSLWTSIDVDAMDGVCRELSKDLRKMDKEIKSWDVYTGLDTTVKDMITFLRAVGELRSNAIRDRHWKQLMKTTGVSFTLTQDMKFVDLLALQLHKFEDEVKGIVDKATKELAMEKVLSDLGNTWNAMSFTYEVSERANKTPLLKSSEELIETLEDNQVILQGMMSSKYVAHFEQDISHWQGVLGTVDSVIALWLEVQQTWSHLENIFMGSEDIRAQLPEDSKRFEMIDATYKEIMAEAVLESNCVKVCLRPGLYDKLEHLQGQLALCEKSLADYLETKRLAFPRFYFVSASDLLDILAKGNQPHIVQSHLPKLFDSIARLEFEPIPSGQPNAGEPSTTALGMYSKEDEYVEFVKPCECTGPVETWLNKLVAEMRNTLRQNLGDAVQAYEEKPREQWIFDHAAQITLTGNLIWWTTEVNAAFSRLEEGYENSMKDYYKKQCNQLTSLITLIQGDLSKSDRMKIMTICTLDVHARDIVAKLVQEKADSVTCFSWQSQLRLRWDDMERDCFVNICDAQFRYSHEYLGNTPRLVVTPLTDRCYITLTQSLHLIMGGSPAGPAGTGKTETTKDLGRALGVMVYVFNCSEQMDYQSIGNIFKGLAQSGAWGCFDEFNRISVEVLSVVATQVKCIQDALRAKKKRFVFQGEDIALEKTVGIFITMNPGYAGRTELPENIKALFRPCSMVVPDLMLICEIMLMAEGFVEASSLARKFHTLYKLNRELLSRQDHYDWGLRAIKSVLVVAGSLKRADPQVPEEHVLMRALRDFNLPKIVTDDLQVFHGLISDLFPKVDVIRKRDANLEKEIRKATLEQSLQAEDIFVLKCVQLDELLAVRHCVFILGNAGTGKSQIWKVLAKTYSNLGKKCVYADLNPKAVSTDDLFGCINPSTREWKDGLLSNIMREQASASGSDPKWIILDGDIDPNWIESLNTVMDDNKVMTLASNERIPLKPSMRLIFEIGDLKYATPATVSRAGILYVNATDLGWNPYVQSWLDRREDATEKATLSVLFDRYVGPSLDTIKTGRFKMVAVEESSMVVTLCNILEALLTPQNVPKGCDKDWYELYFVFASVWAFGGCSVQDQLVDYRIEFSKWWQSEFKNVKFPVTSSSNTVFDYFIDHETKRFVPWTEKIPPYVHNSDVPLQSVMVHTSETIRVRYFLDILADNGKPVLLVGNAGSGKTVLMQDKLQSYGEDRMIVNIPFNFYTTAWSLQSILEKPLEKKAGRNYGPPGTRKLIYFLDDLNMPEVDKYGTASPHTILRQHLDYKHWYDRQKLTLKEIHNCQYVACMNPTAGSFTITSRLQRHFSTFSVNFPGPESLQTIYQSILSSHLKPFGASVQKISDKLVTAALQLHKKVSAVFLPTAVKFHYIFNLRDLANIFQGVLFSTPELLNGPSDLLRLWLHESTRVYGDKMLEVVDRRQLLAFQTEIVKKSFEDLDAPLLFQEPNIHTHFTRGIGTEAKYAPVADWNVLRKLLDDALEQYNDTNAAMNLVLFEDAMSHICRINRILESPRGNALLVGVGGSGKQSLARLAAYISQMDVFQITLKKGYSINDLKADLCTLYQKTGQKKQPIVFLLTDSQIADEKFLVLVNDLLASGDIPNLFPDDEVDNIVASMRNECKALGIQDTKENCWSTFIKNVRRNLKVVLCFSPVGSTLRNRCRKFPAIVNCTSIDWFHEWPEEALINVANRFVQDSELVPEDLRTVIPKFMAFAHQSVNDIARKFLINEKRHTYTTPKSFLELISLYKEMLQRKHQELMKSMDRLENGLTKLEGTASQVDDLKAKLATQEVELKIKNDEAEKLIERVSVDTESVNAEKAIAAEEERKVDRITKEVQEKQRQCGEDLAAAEPALAAAGQALNTLNKNNLTELKSFGSPSDEVKDVTAAVMVLLSPPGKIAKDRSWKACKNMMAKVDGFLDQLITFNKENIDQSNLDALQPYLENPNFNVENIRSKSVAAAGLCGWVINIVKYYYVYRDVEPKRKALEQANQDLQAAQIKLKGIQDKISELDRNLDILRAQFEKATADKLRCEEEAKSTQDTISLANRLVGGLASEKVRWSESIRKFKEQEKTLPGDVLLTAAFVSYVGSFSKKYREELIQHSWLPWLRRKDGDSFIPLSDDVDPLNVLTTSADIAKWNNEGLPNDRISIENATIVTNCKRWPLIIDPQLQGINWIKHKEGSALRCIRLGQKGYLDAIEKAVSSGDTVLLEDIGTSIDAVLDPLLGRNLIKKGKYIRMGDKEVEYDPKFKLILQTRLANPHYPPEIQAQTTLINFTVTLAGLEDQQLADVVNIERPDLEATKAELTKQQNEFKIRLTELEDALLYRLSTAQGNFLGDTALVENLETTKRTSIEIEERVVEAKKTEKKINETRELYRPVAARSSLLYFLLNDLWKIHPMYQYSLNAYKVVFENAVNRSEASEDIKERVMNLIDSITYSVFSYTSRGLFERDKLIFLAQMTFQILIAQNDIDLTELDVLLRAPKAFNVVSPFDWLATSNWQMIKALSNLEVFRNLASDIEGSAKQWKKYCENESPENEKLPQEWKNKSPLEKICILRCLRPDRMSYAMRNFVALKMGQKYIDVSRIPLAKSFEESNPTAPIFFILSPGVDPVKEVEALGQKLGYSADLGNFHLVSLGQGQDVIAEAKLDIAYRNGGWVMLENIHLVTKWLHTLEKKLEALSVNAHPNYRVFLSAEPAGDPSMHVIPISVLQSSIKITNEPPTGMQANIHRALDNFAQEALERCSKDAEYRSILFNLCYFHAVVLERRKFGTIGWNRPYPFSTGDLMISTDVLYNYLEQFPKIPWTDLRYIFGEIMYGGHISDDWDRRLCSSYLDVYLREEIFDGNFELAPGFVAPPTSDLKDYHRYIDENLPAESPYLYGLHPNAEIDVLTKQADKLFSTMLEMQPQETAGSAVTSKEEKVKATLDEILEKLPEPFNIAEMIARVEERTPYISVAIQECDRMSMLISEIRRSLKELDLGLKGDLTITENMEALMNSLYLNKVPATWEKLAYPSLQSLAGWYADFLLRIKELELWSAEFQLPAVVWLSGLFNPQSFLTAIMQTTARRNEWPLDRMVLTVDVMKKTREELNAAPREGAYIHGLFMEGARWDVASGLIQEAHLKELTPVMPIIYVRAIPIDKKETKGVYECPVYRTRQRGPTYIWTFNLKTKEKPQKWTLAGVCLMCSAD